jgi:hypothetical protein
LQIFRVQKLAAEVNVMLLSSDLDSSEARDEGTGVARSLMERR